VRFVNHSLDPIGACEPEASSNATLDHRSAGRSGRWRVDDGGVGRSGRTAGPHAPLVHKDNARATFDGRNRSPATGRPAPDDENVGRQVEAVSLGPPGHLATHR
jgi:hypothetical protein